MAKFILAGTLKDNEFGAILNMKARDVSTGIQSMIYQIKGFRNKLAAMNIKIRINGRTCTGNAPADVIRNMSYPLGDNDTVVISPALGGAGGNTLAGAFMIIAGVVAIAVAIPSGGMSLAAWSAGAMALAASGALMVFGGIAMLFTKFPKASTASTSSTDKNTSFSSLDNMAGQGRAIPIVFGRMLTGSCVIQQSVETMGR